MKTEARSAAFSCSGKKGADDTSPEDTVEQVYNSRQWGATVHY